MQLKMKLTGRLYTPYFSQHKVSLLVAFLAFALSFTPLAQISVPQAVNGDLVFTLRYIALFSLAVGFRGNYPALVSLHKTITIFLALVPTLFFVLATQLIFIIVVLAGIFSLLAGQIEPEMIRSILEGFAIWFLYADATAGVWLLYKRVVLRQYRYPYDTDEQNKFATVTTLLLLFGFWGVHRFYVGKTRTGILFLGTMGFLGMGVLWDAIMLFRGRFTDVKGRSI